jgi:large subunit ribosomal protein L33
MAKGKSVKVRLVPESGPSDGFFYTTMKNPKMAHKLKLRKYNPVTRQHEWFEEKKIK